MSAALLAEKTVGTLDGWRQRPESSHGRIEDVGK
jgi:hypothetical protein